MLLTEQYLRNRQFIRPQQVSLMQLHEFNHKLLQQLLPDSFSDGNGFHSTMVDKPTLQITVRERFKFTTELAMSMLFDDAVSDALVIRIYHDAQLAELVYSNEFEKQYRRMAGQVDARNQASLRYSQNCFFNKWLIYLLQNGFNSQVWVQANNSQELVEQS